MGSAQENFCLRWNDFESNLSAAFQELRNDDEFFDVTLATDEDQVGAHTVVLSACSPHLKEVIRKHSRLSGSRNNMLIYLRGVRHCDLISVLEFMYCGAVNVAQQDLNSFLAVAEDLKVKGLTQNIKGNSASTSQKNGGSVGGSGKRSLPKTPSASTPGPSKRHRPSSPDPEPVKDSMKPKEEEIQLKTEDLKDDEEDISGHGEGFEDPIAFDYESGAGDTTGEGIAYEGDDGAGPSSEIGKAVDPVQSRRTFDTVGDLNIFINESSSKVEDGTGILCLLCGIVISIKSRRRHFYDKHAILAYGVQCYQCPLCEKDFKRREHFRRHIKLLHRDFGDMIDFENCKVRLS